MDQPKDNIETVSTEKDLETLLINLNADNAKYEMEKNPHQKVQIILNFL